MLRRPPNDLRSRLRVNHKTSSREPPEQTTDTHSQRCPTHDAIQVRPQQSAVRIDAVAPNSVALGAVLLEEKLAPQHIALRQHELVADVNIVDALVTRRHPRAKCGRAKAPAMAGARAEDLGCAQDLGKIRELGLAAAAEMAKPKSSSVKTSWGSW